jgi:hypothetical protein
VTFLTTDTALFGLVSSVWLPPSSDPLLDADAGTNCEPRLLASIEESLSPTSASAADATSLSDAAVAVAGYARDVDGPARAEVALM